VVKEAVDDVVLREGSASLNTKVKTVARPVKEAVRERVQDMMNESAEV
jgi:hypothetical protein